MRFTCCIYFLLLLALYASPAYALRTAEVASGEAKARNGNIASRVNVGDHYYARGNFAEALEWYRLAAKQGQYDARRRIADMYIQGQGTDKNLLKGYVLLCKILNQNTLYPESQQSTTRYVEELATLLTSEQREQAEKLIREAWDF